MTPVAFLARRQQFAEHLAPVWLALPEEARGPFIVWDDRTQCAAERMGVTVTRRHKRSDQRYVLERMDGQPVVVAGSHDMLKANSVGGHIALLTHGIGQSYGGRRDEAARHIGSPGGNTRDMVSLFLHPGTHPAVRDKVRYPKARVEVVGSPMLERLHRKPRDGREPVVAITTHWDWALCPETHSALTCPHYGGWYGIHDAITELAKRYHVLGHGHPRLFTHPEGDIITPMWEGMGIEVVESFDEVCRRADVLVADNTSVIYEFAATDRPVVLLDPPWYDLDVPHGLRFGEPGRLVGPHVSDPRTLTDKVAEALTARRWREQEEALDMVFGHRDHAAERAAVTLLDWLGERRMAA
jgi:hypothetical protein